MKWCMGFDLRDHHSAPAVLARSFGNRATFVAVHVIEPEFERLASDDFRDGMHRAARSSLEAAVERAGLPAERTEVVIGHGGSADEILGTLALEHGAEGIIVARRAARVDDCIVRLGRTARRLMRRLPVTIVVVPPDLTPQAVGSGPVLIAGDGEHDARRAMKFARDVAAELTRTVEMVHVRGAPFRLQATYLPADELARMEEHYRDEQHAKLRDWISAYQLDGLPCHETEGPIVTRLIDVARDRDACMIVCASRELRVTERIFSSSVGSQLAATASRPIAVVPRWSSRAS
jgi:nucleotide-binding universal stress UspA family protein